MNGPRPRGSTPSLVDEQIGTAKKNLTDSGGMGAGVEIRLLFLLQSES